MATLRRGSPPDTTAISAAKLGLLAVAVVSVVSLAILAAPHLGDLIAAVIPPFSSLISPAYLFITVHLIILAIWKLSDHKQRAPPPPPPPPPRSSKHSPPEFLPSRIPEGSGDPSPSDTSCVTTESDERSTASSRADVRKSVKPPPESVEMVEEVEEEGQSMDATWNAIAEEAAVEESAGEDELTRRFEDFIRKNHDQIRLQREESEGRRLEMTNRALIANRNRLIR
ncbi:uncharacterized protein [Typha latifolia]|uniref:uncharacterized protein n=1 Tax=Typha latifolia TaxID=4733 RepID=UPI003C2F94B7